MISRKLWSKKCCLQNLYPKPPQIGVGLRSDLLRRRPDIRQSERLFGAATANIRVAVASFFPVITLIGSGLKLQWEMPSKDLPDHGPPFPSDYQATIFSIQPSKRSLPPPLHNRRVKAFTHFAYLQSLFDFAAIGEELPFGGFLFLASMHIGPSVTTPLPKERYSCILFNSSRASSFSLPLASLFLMIRFYRLKSGVALLSLYTHNLPGSPPPGAEGKAEGKMAFYYSIRLRSLFFLSYRKRPPKT